MQIEFAGFVVLLIVGFTAGQIIERRHFRDLARREKQQDAPPAIASRYPPSDAQYHQQLITGNVVIATDYFKSFTASLINLFGGRVTPFESMLDRARRESLLRLRGEAKRLGASSVFNVKYETVRVVGAMEVLAYGTALIPLDKPESQHSAA